MTKLHKENDAEINVVYGLRIQKSQRNSLLVITDKSVIATQIYDLT